MKILISADMEGATGVTWPADVKPGTEQWQRFRAMLTSDVNATVAGLYDAGATAVVINEAHATMRNLLLEKLDSRAVMITGRHKDLGMLEGIQHGNVDGVAFVGYHAGAGAEGVLAHTYLPNSITGVRVNGEPASEGRMNALVSEEFGVPVILVTGDDRTCADAATYAPQAQTAAVKECVTRYSALCPPPEVTAAAIRPAAAKAMTLAGRRPPPPAGSTPPAPAGPSLSGSAGTTPPAPAGPSLSGSAGTTSAAPTLPGSAAKFQVEVEVDAAQLAQAAAIIPAVRRTGDRTVTYASSTALEMMRWFRVVTTMISSATEEQYG
jgi:D-amino peptidase